MAARRREELLMNVGRRVGEIRAERGLTQEQLAESLDVTLRHLQAVEGGSENLTVKTLGRIASALNVDIADLLEKPQTPRPKRGRPKATTVADDDMPKTPRPRASRAQDALSNPSTRSKSKRVR
jgi:transcriptional regulator with XRE-family HTH domain